MTTDLIIAGILGFAGLWYVLTTFAVWRFCDAMDGDYLGLRIGVTLFWPVVLPACGLIFFLAAIEHTFSRRQR